MQPPYLRTDSTVSAETPTARKVTTVTSPHAASPTALASEPQPDPLDRGDNDHGGGKNSGSGASDNSNKGAAKLMWRLRRRRETNVTSAPGTFATPSPISSLLDQKKNPLDVLRYLGSATFNDAPLHTFLSNLDLRLPSSRSSTGTTTTTTNENYTRDTTAAAPAVAAMEQSRWHAMRDNDRRRRRSTRQRTDAVAVHLGDIAARTFRVEVVAGEASPLQTLVEAYHGCPWDGSAFLLIPLEDEPRVPLGAVVPPHLVKDLTACLQADEDSVAPSGAHTASMSFGAESQIGLDLPGMPTTFLRSAKNFETYTAGGEERDGQPLALAAAAASAVIDGPVCGKVVEGTASGGDTTRSVVPCWKRFSTTAALYLTLGDAGCCDTTYFPYLAVQLCTWGDLVAQQQTRIEMMASGSAAALRTLQAARCEKKAEPVPVAVLFPTTRKGIMRLPLSLTTQPFTDAEVFQLFYLQLIFRAYFDVRFPSLGVRLPGWTAWHLRSDFVAVRSSGKRGVAFEHPLRRDEWVCFPAHTRLLTLLCLKEAVVPLYSTPAELQESAVQPLFGAGDALPCLGEVGHAVARWAATVEVTSPASAMTTLETLFEKMGSRYHSTRAELWSAFSASSLHGRRAASDERSQPSKAALLFRCGVATVGAALNQKGGTLSRFFVPVERLGVPVSLMDGSTTTALSHDGAASAELSTSLPNTMQPPTYPPCIPRGSSRTNTMLPSGSGTPHQPVLREVLLNLNTATDALRNSSITEAFSSTTAASPLMNQSRTNTFANTFDLEHLSALQAPEEAGALETSKLLCTSPTAVAALAGGKSGVDADRGPLGSSTQLVSVPSSTKKEKTPRPAKLEFNPLLSSPLEVPPEAERRASPIDDTQADRETTVDSTSSPQNLSFVGYSSPFTKQESLVTRWRYYMQSGNCSIFEGATAGIKLFEFLGRGGSGLVYRGIYGSRRLPVAVKVLIIPDGMSHERYVRESLTDVAFYVLANQLHDYGVSYNGRAHDFIVSSVAPEGLPAADAAEARRGGDAATTKLCYFITDLMDGTIGRFLDANDDDFDPMYDQLRNSPLQEGELFQFLFNQLAFKALFDWRVMDLMLNNQLRGDNVGYRYVSLPPESAVYLRAHPEEATALALARQYYAGLLYAFQFSQEDNVKYLRFPATTHGAACACDAAEESDGAPIKVDDMPLRLICMIDVGQGTQPNVDELARNQYIGETIVASCVQDDGFGRFWPLDELYCRYVDVKGELSKEVAAWGSNVRIHSQEDAFHALQELFLQYYPTYGVEAPTEEELRTYLCLSWTPSNIADLKSAYVYRAA
jgi:hypothetical protein